MMAIGIGSIFVWSGIKGWSLLGTAADLVTGKQPSQANINALTSGDTTTFVGTSTSGLAGAALQYQGHAYQYGGAPGPDGSQPWDCSSFVNFIAGIKLKLPIPGYAAGKYDGTFHGPPTGTWGIWTGIRHVTRQEVQAGDIIVWVGHMGIALDNTQMISALNPEVRTTITPIEGHGNGPILCYGRYGVKPSGPKFI
jgi:cell wall-associated NlpC family hydrolase